MKNEVEGLGLVSVVKLEEMREEFALLEGNDGEQGIARECQIESGLWSSMAVPVFLPGGEASRLWWLRFASKWQGSGG